MNNPIIDPVKSVCNNYSCNKGKDIQVLNDSCYSICTAFGGGKTCEKDCEVFIENQRKRIFGVGHCDHQTPHKPVYWNQVPRFVPSLIRNGVDVQTARHKCKEMCNTQSLRAECVQYCDLDADAVVVEQPTIEPLEQPTIEPLEQPTVNPQSSIKYTRPVRENYEEPKSWNRHVFLLLCVISLIIILILFKYIR
jgi:hypothetical protein